jgi:serine/threonine protein phosphatase PrpC
MPPDSSASLPCKLRWSALTHRGRVRPNNEDAFLALNFDGHELRFLGKTGEASARQTDFVFAVSDGMGGANSGEFASRIAVDHITKLMPKSFRMSAMGLASGFTDVLQELFADIHEVMLRHGRSYEECAGMGATLSLCWFTPEWMYYGHIGDSRIYYLPREGGLNQLTHDHSHVGWLRRQGRINEREARSHPQRNALNQALGAGHQIIDPQVGAVGYQPGDRFLLCTDGLTDGLWDRAVQELIREPGPAAMAKAPAHRLVEASLEASGRDNITAIVIETESDTGN